MKKDLSYIKPLHREIARRLVVGQRLSRISNEIDISDTRLSIIVNSPLFKLELKRLEDARDAGVVEVNVSLQDVAPIALEQVEKTMYEAKSETLRFKAAESILDRAGYGAIKKGSVQFGGGIEVRHSDLTDNEIRKMILERLRRAAEVDAKKKMELNEVEAFEVEFDEVEGVEDVHQMNSEEEKKSPISIFLK